MKSRRAVVTGASSGIGAATVRLMRSRGWDVIGVARRADRLEALAAETGCTFFVADLTVSAEVDALRDHLAGLGGIHVLVNNAGGAFGLASIEESDADDWRRMFEVNVISVKLVTSALLPLLRDGARDVGSADIMTVTSLAGLVAYEGGAGYNAAKFAAHALVGALRLELVGEPIRVMEIAPGMVKTDEFSLKRFGGDQSRVDALYENVIEPLTAEDIAEAMVHALEQPRHINQDLIVIKPVAQAAPHKLVRGELKPKQ